MEKGFSGQSYQILNLCHKNVFFFSFALLLCKKEKPKNLDSRPYKFLIYHQTPAILFFKDSKFYSLGIFCRRYHCIRQHTWSLRLHQRLARARCEGPKHPSCPSSTLFLHTLVHLQYAAREWCHEERACWCRLVNFYFIMVVYVFVMTLCL